MTTIKETIEVILKSATASALLVQLDENSEPVWLPRSKCKMGDGGDGWFKLGSIVELTAPEWLLKDKGLI